MLAVGDFCSVEGCGCGTLHVSVGPVTLRLRADVVASVWRTLGEALARVGHDAGAGHGHHARQLS